MKARWLLAFALIGGVAHAHGSAQENALAREVWLLAPLLLSGAWYALGFARMLTQSREGRSVLWRRGFLFAAGWLTIAGSLLSPLHELGRHSFTAHMAEHELLMLVAAPLLALSKPLGIFMWALPKSQRLSLARAAHRPAMASGWQRLTDPLTVTLLQAIALWLWHAPALFDRALQSEAWHALQHLSFLFTALLFWWGITRTQRAEHSHGVAALYLFLTALHTGLLGALMSFSISPWYQGYAQLDLGAIPFGLSPIEDQQLAGLIMWIPGGVVHAAAALVYLALWLRRMERTPDISHA